MSRYLPQPPSILRWPGGLQSVGKAIGWMRGIRWPAAAGSAPVSHSGFVTVIPSSAWRWDRELLDIRSLGSALLTGQSIKNKPVPAFFQDLLIWCNGVDAVQVYDPATANVYDLGLTAPTAAPGLADQGSGSFAGKYLYAYRYKRSNTGEFSALSPVDKHTASGSGQYIRVTFSASAESDVDKVEIYRSKTGYAGLYRIAEVDDTSSPYDDETADADIDITLVPPLRPAPGSTATVPVFDYITIYLQRLWGLVGDTLYWSEPNSPWLIPATNQMKIQPNDRDECTGFGIAQDRLFIFKKRHTYALASVDIMQGLGGHPVLVPDVRLVDDSTGAASQHALANVENAVIFLSGEGKLYQIPSQSGLVAMELAPQLEEEIQSLHTNRLQWAEMAYAETERKVFLGASFDGAAHNNQGLVLDLTNLGWISCDIPMEALAELRERDGRSRMVYGGVRGDLHQLGVGFGQGARSGTLSGTVTSATRNTLTDSTASFDSDTLPGLPVALFDEYWNLVQTNMVAARDSATQLTTVWPWFTVPENRTFYYCIGSSFLEWAFGWTDYGTAAWKILRTVEVSYEPTEGKCAVLVGVDEEPPELYGEVDLSGPGHQTVHLQLGGRRFKTMLRGLSGATEFIVTGIEWDVEAMEGMI